MTPTQVDVMSGYMAVLRFIFVNLAHDRHRGFVFEEFHALGLSS